MGVIIGIDLGTTNSCAAIVDENGKPKVVSDTGGSFTIPSVVAINDKGDRLVGQQAKRQALINPLNTVWGAKRLIGRDYQSKTMQKIKDHFTYELVEGDNSDVLIKLRDEVYGLDEISALLLDNIRNTAQDRLEQEVVGAVVTVPAYFNDRQRQAVKDAGKIAMINVERIINEPTAAALAYGYGKQLDERIAVYDLGGGTFDVSILEVRDNVYEVKATGGDNLLGGNDIDERIMDTLMVRFEEKTGVDLSMEPIAIQRIKDASERAKIDLSAKNEVRINIPYIAVTDDGPVNFDETITRKEIEEITEDLISRTLEVCGNVLKDGGFTIDDINEVLLVGGQTRMPYVQEAVEKYFGQAPSKQVHPDEAVAIGAAIMAHSLSEKSDFQIVLLDVLPMSIGVGLSKNRFHKIFPRNTTIPNEKSTVFTTSKDNQESLKLKFYQGDSDDLTNNELLGEFKFSGIKPAPKGQAKIEVIMRISPEGIMKLEARDSETKARHETTLSVSSGITQKTTKKNLIIPQAPRKRSETTPATGVKVPTGAQTPPTGGVKAPQQPAAQQPAPQQAPVQQAKPPAQPAQPQAQIAPGIPRPKPMPEPEKKGLLARIKAFFKR